MLNQKNTKLKTTKPISENESVNAKTKNAKSKKQNQKMQNQKKCKTKKNGKPQTAASVQGSHDIKIAKRLLSGHCPTPTQPE